MQPLEPGASAGLKKLYVWLLPAEPFRGRLGGLLARFADEFGGPRFEPHVTLYSGPWDGASMPPDETLRKAGANQKALLLAPCGVAYSPEYSKSCFVKFSLTDELRMLSENIGRALGARVQYALDPHLSLFYGTLNAEAREKISREVLLSAPILFDALWAVGSPLERSIDSPQDVSTWRLTAEQNLS